LQETVEAWRTVFYIAGAVYTFGTVFYGLLGSGEVQPWAMLRTECNEEHDVFPDRDEEKRGD